LAVEVDKQDPIAAKAQKLTNMSNGRCFRAAALQVEDRDDLARFAGSSVRVLIGLDPTRLKKDALGFDHVLGSEAAAVATLEDAFRKAFEI
jgi:hypothetical protein